MQRLNSQQVAKLWNFIAGAISAWMLLYPTPYNLLLLALLPMPCVALLLMQRYKDEFQIDGQWNDFGGNLTLLILLPAGVLFIRSQTDVNLLDHTMLVGMALACSLIFVAIVIRVYEEAYKPMVLFLCLVLSFLHGFGALALINARFDPFAIQSYNVNIESRRVSHGKSTAYYLQLAPWGPTPTSEEVRVRSTVFNDLASSNTTCVTLHKGLLNMPWFVVGACPCPC
ncbi:hypothetical protein [Undibacterium sp. TJN19]|uniref:hypothetical protein n=1 Tax=Undibacterium sp. TJN19 TaxID=3413055 RepID=UPI003BF30B2F